MPQSKLRLAFQTVLEGGKAGAGRRKKFQNLGGIKSSLLQVLGTGSRTESPVLALRVTRAANTRQSNTAKSLYLFNLNFKGKLVPGSSALSGSLHAVFFTGLSWEKQIAGSHSILLAEQVTVPSFNVQEKLHIHGPNGVKDFMSAGCSFVFSQKRFEKFNTMVEYCEEESVPYVDENVTIRKVFLNPKDERMETHTASYVCQVTGDYENVVDMNRVIADHGPLQDSTAQVVHKRSVISKFIAQMRQGRTATHPLTGKTIDPAEYISKRKSPSLIILDCPTSSHFDMLQQSESFRSSFDGSDTPCVIAHITPEDLSSSQPYRDWMRKFGTGCQHLVINETNKDCYDAGVCAHQHSMNLVCDQLFPPINERLVPDYCEPGPGGVVKVQSGLRFDMGIWKDDWGCRSKEEFDSAFSQSMDEVAEASDEIELLKNSINLTPKNHEGYYPRLVVLGCGASAPQKYRAQPSFLLRVNAESSIVIDCGGAAAAKIHQHFGEEAEDVLATVKGVFLSHYHMDHHSGFISLIKEVVRIKSLRRRSFEDASKIYCLMPMNMIMFYDSYCKHYLQQVHDMVVFVPTQKVRHGHMKELDSVNALCAILGIKSLLPIPVTHGVITYGLSLLTHCGKKVVYSADTLPMNDRVIYEGMGADLLIHDCLYTDEEWEMDARLRKHSYLKGTLATASAMQAKFTLLTHFAPFLPAVPVSNLPDPYSKNVACAYDFLDVSLSDLKELPKLEPAILAVYKESMQRYDIGMHARRDRQRFRNEAIQRLTHIM